VDKRIIFAVAGSGKTTYIVNNLSCEKRSLIITYTDGNYSNIRRKITAQFNGVWPENITLMTYYSFLYHFCYKPFLADMVKARGVLFDKKIIEDHQKRKRYTTKLNQDAYYMTDNKYFYSNRLSYYIERKILGDIKDRIIKYFDEFIIDEVQDIAGRDFNFLEHIMAADVNMLFVGDYYQHTFDTSRDGNVNKSLFNDITAYETRFTKKGFLLDKTTLVNSRRCSKNVCKYIQDNIGILISSNRPDTDNTKVEFITDTNLINSILMNKKIEKLHYQKGADFGVGHKNWGATKGEDHYDDICVLLNKNTAIARKTKTLDKLPMSTRNKLYVAITRARGNVYLIDESSIPPLSS
jgi:superfamily I DNA/RNA helicase